MKGTFMKEKLSFQLKILLFILGEKTNKKPHGSMYYKSLQVML